MSTEFEIKSIDAVVWRELTSSFVDHNYRQLYEYSELAAERINAVSEHVAIWHGQDLKGLANVRIKFIPFTSTGVAYINGAPLIKHTSTLGAQELTQSFIGCLEALKQEYVGRRGLLLRVTSPVSDQEIAEAQHQAYEYAGFKKFDGKGKYRTILLDISLSEDLIRKRFHPKWRGHLNKAERNKLTTVRGTDVSLINEFKFLFDGLVERKKLQIDIGPDFFCEIQKTLPENEKFVVHLALSDGKPVSGHIGSYLGNTAVYLLGATNDIGLQLQAAYLQQWSVIQYAKQRGCTRYDLGGIDPASNPDVYHFKQRMGGEDVTSAGPYEATSFLSGKMIHLAENIYNIIKRSR